MSLYTPCQCLDTPTPPPPQYRHLVVKTGTTAGQHDITSACGSGWCFVRCNPFPITPYVPLMPPGRGSEWWRVVLLQVSMTFCQAMGQADVWSDITPPHHLHMPPQCPHASYINLVAKCSTASGLVDNWLAFGSGWPVYWRVNLVPAARVIPAPWVDTKVVAVKKLVCYCLEFSVDYLVLMSMSSLQYTIFSFQEYVFSCLKHSQFLQYLPKYSPLSSSFFTTYWTKWYGHGKMIGRSIWWSRHVLM